jgi:hypothetical protein
VWGELKGIWGKKYLYDRDITVSSRVLMFFRTRLVDQTSEVLSTYQAPAFFVDRSYIDGKSGLASRYTL